MNECELRIELAEAKAEIARHHRDFAKISKIVNEALDLNMRKYEPLSAYWILRSVIREVRGVVG